MLVGRFGDTSGRPYFSAHVSIPLLSSRGEVSFVFDTGADRTVLMPTEGMALSVDYAKLSHEAALGRILKSKSSGVGGSADVYVVPSRVVFLGQGDELFGYDIDLAVYEPNEHAKKIPSLLGRDIIDHWATTYNKHGIGIVAEVVYSDVQWP